MEDTPNSEDNERNIIVTFRNHDTLQHNGFVKKTCEETLEAVPDEVINKTIIPNYIYSLGSERVFRCDVCQTWFMNIEHLFTHVVNQHEDIQLTKDLEVALLNQLKNIEEVETSIMKLISNKKIRSAKRLLKCSLPVLRGFYTSLFVPNDNIFEPFIMMMRSRIKSIIRNSKVNVSENINEVHSNIITSNGKCEIVLTKSKSKKRKRSGVDLLDSINPTEGSISNYMSDDEICLKDAIKLHKLNEIKGENNGNDIDSDESDEELPVVEYYLVPQRLNGKLSSLDKKIIFTAISDSIERKEVNLDEFNDVILKRFNVEMDEIIPKGVFMVSEYVFDDKWNNWTEMRLCDFLCKSKSKEWRKKRKNKTNDEVWDGQSYIDYGEIKTVAIEFQCEICDSYFITYKAKEEHEKSHVMYESSWYCPSCEVRFPTLSTIKSHYKEKKCKNGKYTPMPGPSRVIKYDKKSAKAPKCELCERKFTSLARLNQHINHVHKGIAFGVPRIIFG